MVVSVAPLGAGTTTTLGGAQGTSVVAAPFADEDVVEVDVDDTSGSGARLHAPATIATASNPSPTIVRRKTALRGTR